MKKLIVICLLTIIFNQAVKAQLTTNTPLNSFNIERQKISKNGLKFLASYTIANIAYGSIAASNATGTNKYFHKMNAIWNGVTLGIIGFGYVTAKKEGNLTFAQSLTKQQQIEKLFLFNAGLDVAYIAGGAYLKERAKTTTKNSEMLKGYGHSIMLQGSVLLLFDGIMYAIHNKHGKNLYEMASKVSMSSTSNGIGLVVKL